MKKVLKNPIAQRAIAIDGKHFEQGEPITDVAQDQVDICIRLGSVVDAASEEGQIAVEEAERAKAAAADAAANAKKG